MVHNPILYEGDGPVYETVQTRREINNVTESDVNMPRSVVAIGGQHNNFPQNLSDVARYVDRPVQLQYLAPDVVPQMTPLPVNACHCTDRTKSDMIALKKNGQERNKFHLTLSLCDEPSTGPKLRFPTCPAYQNMTFPHITYTYLAEDRVGFYATCEMCRKSCSILQISYMYEIQLFV